MRGKNGNSDRLYFLGLQKSLQTVTAAMKLKDTHSPYRKPRSLLLVALQNLGKIILVVASAKSHSYFPVFSISEVGEPSSCCPHLLQFFPLNILGYNVIFPVVMYGCENWTIKKAEHLRIDVFELWCWRRLLRVPWTARRSNQSILKEISPTYSLEGLMLKLKLQYFGHLMQRVNSLEKTCCWERLRAGGKGDDRGWDGWMASLTRWTWVCAHSGSWWWTGNPGV